MPGSTQIDSASRYARCIEASRRISWDIDADVIRERGLDPTRKFLPDGLTGVRSLDFLSRGDRRLISQIQGRTYANMFALVESFINSKVVELGRGHRENNPLAYQALTRFSEEEIKHQELFRRIDRLAAEVMPAGYSFVGNPGEVAGLVLGKSTWAVLALTCVIELFTQAHYRHSIEPEEDICALFKDVFLYHWREESQHAILDELEWRQHNTRLAFPSRDAAVTDLIDLVAALDGLLQQQAASDTRYFLRVCGHAFYEENRRLIGDLMLDAYRYQYILSGTGLAQFQAILGDLVIASQLQRVQAALATLEPTVFTRYRAAG